MYESNKPQALESFTILMMFWNFGENISSVFHNKEISLKISF